jgi:hypothetical protein
VDVSEKFSAIDLIPRVRRGEKLSSGAFRTERRFFDFVIDGLSLRDTIACEYDLASVLWINAPVPTAIAQSIRRLLLIDPGDLPDGRVALYTCPECGDLGCGGITVDIKLSEGAVVWSKFGYQNDYDNDLYIDAFQQYGPFQFDLNRYRALLLSAMPEDHSH